jgi:hypothetical protein
MYQLEYVIRVCKRRGVETSISGQALMNEDVLKFLIQKEINSVCVKAEYAKSFSEKIYSYEKELFSGTDKEPRKYELEKNKEEYLDGNKQKNNEPKTIEDIENLEETEKLKEDIEVIEKEKKEYEENGVLKEEKVNGFEKERVENFGEDNSDKVKENSEEKFDEEIESSNLQKEINTKDTIFDVDEAVKAIEEEKNEFVKKELKEKKNDFGIF